MIEQDMSALKRVVRTDIYNNV
ncbi:protein of unknown function [Microbacterium sp. Nx66]|nr:protein of unknown function [Microbacterium sp. Nx66]